MVTKKWYCHEDAPSNNHYFINPSLITKNISKINELKYLKINFSIIKIEKLINYILLNKFFLY